MNSKLDQVNWKEVYDRGILHEGNISRLGQVMRKASSGQSIKVGFIGGSITAGAAATTPESCYAYRVVTWWKNTFPNSIVEYSNVGVGATNSQFGVARVEEDLLCLAPDVVFVEFSVNDTDEEFYGETFEGLIRNILGYQTQPALFMFNNVFYDDGHNAQRVHNLVGTYYDLPIVSIKESLFHEIQKGTFTNTELSVDNLHPNDLGHQLIAGVITNLLDQIYQKVSGGETSDQPYQFPEKPITLNRYANSKRYSCRNCEPECDGFYRDEVEKQGVWDVFRYGWYGKEEEDTIRFQLEGAKFSVQYRKYALHPAPIAQIIIDHDEEHAIILDANFEETWGDCLFLQDIVTFNTSGKHIVEIKIISAVKEKEFYLASIITA